MKRRRDDFSSGWIRPTIFIVSMLTISACVHAPSGPAQEVIPENEPQTVNDIIALLSNQLEKQYEGQAFRRDTHPKSNGCVKGQFLIEGNVPEKFRHGIFKETRSYSAWIRFSNSAPELTHDKDPDFRGLAIKLFDVEGERLPVPGDEQQTQDFLFVAFHAFFAGNPQHFHDFFDAVFNKGKLGVAWYFITHPRAFVNTLQGRQQFANPLEITWFSVAPFLLGPEQPENKRRAVKYKVQSCKKHDSSIPDDPSYNYLREAMAKELASGGACLEFLIQEQTNPATMPIEDTLTAWDEEESPFVKVATIEIPAQTIPMDQPDFNDDPRLQFCENLSFNPWHGLKAHKPIGGINRARRDVMKAISDLRLRQRGVVRKEPTGAETF